MHNTPECYLCRAKSLELCEDIFPPYRVWRCPHCTLCFVVPQPPTPLLAEAYGEEYYLPWLGRQAAGRRALWRCRIHWLRNLAAQGPLLDVGCGDGGFLAAAKDLGFEVQGTEFSPYAAAHIQNSLGIPVAVGELQSIGLPEAAFNTVTLWHSLEHTRDPLAVLRTARRLLKPNGLLVVAVPNVQNLVFRVAYRILKGHPPHLFSPHDRELHLFGFTGVSLRRILDRAGFAEIHVGPDHGQVRPVKRLVDWLAAGVSSCAGKEWWNALLATARKQTRTPSSGSAETRA